MDLDEVKQNIRRTIAGKEMLLATYENSEMLAYPRAVKTAMVEFLKINISDLKKILDDLESINEVS